MLFTPIIVARQHVKTQQPFQVVTTNGVGNTNVTLSGLESFTRYVIYVAGFTSKGDGPFSAPTEAGWSFCIIPCKFVDRIQI